MKKKVLAALLLGIMATSLPQADAKLYMGYKNFEVDSKYVNTGKIVPSICLPNKAKGGVTSTDNNVTRIYTDIIKANPQELYKELPPFPVIQDVFTDDSIEFNTSCYGGGSTVISSWDIMSSLIEDNGNTRTLATDQMKEKWYNPKLRKRHLESGNPYTTSSLASTIGHELGHAYQQMHGMTRNESQDDTLGMMLLEKTQWYSPTATLYSYNMFVTDDAYKKHEADAVRKKKYVDYISQKTNGKMRLLNGKLQMSYDLNKGAVPIHIDAELVLPANKYTYNSFERTLNVGGTLAYLYSLGIPLQKNMYVATGRQLFGNGSSDRYIMVKRDKVGLPPKLVDYVASDDEINKIKNLMWNLDSCAGR